MTFGKDIHTETRRYGYGLFKNALRRLFDCIIKGLYVDVYFNTHTTYSVTNNRC